jgi:hypothetical protein
VPHPRKVATAILGMFKKQHARVGYVIPTVLILALLAREGWSLTDIEQGIDYGVAEGWFKAASPTFVGLTEAGFVEIGKG